MTNKQVIGLCGRMGSGKDTVAALLRMLGYQRVAFADQVREELEIAVGEGALPRDVSNTYDRIFDDFLDTRPEEVWGKPTAEHVRRLLQWWGTDYRRNQNPDYWIDRAREKANLPKVVFTDVRFPNEVALVRELGGIVWYISRDVPEYGLPGHISESALSNIQPDITIDNSCSIYELAGAVQQTLCAS